MGLQRAVGRAALVLLLGLPVLMPPAWPAAAQEVPFPPDRYGTAARAATSAFPDGADVAVLASGESFADALAAGPLAASYGAPVLLTARDALPEITRSTLTELGVAEVLVMGGPAAVSTEVSDRLSMAYEVSRVAGADRYETAVRVATGAAPGGSDVAVLASGETFADALAAAPLAAAYGAPILLTGRDTLPDVTRKALADLGVADVLVMGGPAAVSTEVSNRLFADYQVSRVAGPDRYATAARAALDAFPQGADVPVLASGETFAALAAAPLAAAHDAPVVLTGRDTLPEITGTTLAELDVADVIVMGGPAAVSTDVSNQLFGDYQVSRIAGGP